jgi:hypothetical protein
VSGHQERVVDRTTSLDFTGANVGTFSSSFFSLPLPIVRLKREAKVRKANHEMGGLD